MVAMNPMKPTYIRQRMRDYAAMATPTEFSDGLRGAIIGILNAEFTRYTQAEIEKRTSAEKKSAENSADFARRMIFGYLYGDENKPYEQIHAKQLTPQMWNGLCQWVKPKGTEKMLDSGKTVVVWKSNRADWTTEVRWVHTRAMWMEATSHQHPDTLMRDMLARQYQEFEAPGGIESGGLFQAAIMMGAEPSPNMEGWLVQEPLTDWQIVDAVLHDKPLVSEQLLNTEDMMQVKPLSDTIILYSEAPVDNSGNLDTPVMQETSNKNRNVLAEAGF